MLSRLKVSKKQLRCLKISAILTGAAAISSGIATIVEAFGTSAQTIYALEVCLPLTIVFTITSCVFSSIIHCSTEPKINNDDSESKNKSARVQKPKKVIVKSGPILKPQLATQKPSSLILNPPEATLDHKNENNSESSKDKESPSQKIMKISDVGFLDLNNVPPPAVLFSSPTTDRNSERISPSRIVSEKDRDRRYGF